MKISMVSVLLACCILTISSKAICLGDVPVYLDSMRPIEDRIEDLLRRMTPAEKAELLGGTGFDSKPIERLGIPALKMADGPLGVRWERSTAFPAGVALAATWDPELIHKVGATIGRELKSKGRHVILGPCVNIHRVPYGGRNFESYGEDPYLASRIAVAFVKGVQSENVIATTKHFALNNQEFERNSIDVKVDERTLHEIYLPAFKATVQEAGVWSIMSAYNRLNGQYCSSNTNLLTDILKNKWGFKGFVMSDWGAVHSVVPTLYAGMDIEMPRDRYLTVENTLKTLQSGLIKESKLDDKVRRMLRAMFAIGLFDGRMDNGAIDTPEHRKLALNVAQNGIVLLKNEDGILPLDSKKIKQIAVIGPYATEAVTGGGGSSKVDPVYEVNLFDGLRSRLGKKVSIKTACGIAKDIIVEPIKSDYLKTPDGTQNGLLGKYYNNMLFDGEPILTRVDKEINFDIEGGSFHEMVNADQIAVIWTGKLLPPESGMYEIGTGSDDGTRLYLNDKLIVDNWGEHGVDYKTATVELKKGGNYDIKIEFYENSGDAAAILAWRFLDDETKESIRQKELNKAIDIARGADVAVLYLGSNHFMETEGKDRESLNLPGEQIELLKAVAGVNKNTIIVINSGAAVLMDEWLNDVKAVLEAWFPGQEGGNAIADVLVGNVNPSGKLPTSFIRIWEDSPAYANYPGEDGILKYEEGIFVGYRHLDHAQIEPLFPFGHGLSYTTFEYSDLELSNKAITESERLTVSFTIKNTGKWSGAEVAQLYVRDELCSVIRPEKELKGFIKVLLNSGEQKRVSMTLDKSALSFYDIVSKDWKAEPGKFKVMIGSSSRVIRLQGEFDLQ